MTVLLLAALLAHDEPTRPAAYANAKLLIEPAELDAAIKASKPMVILDLRPFDEYIKGHLPGAFTVQLTNWAGDSRMFDSELFAHGIRTYGTPVVLYDSTRGADAGRLWWLMRSWGLTDIRLLNGGWRGWGSPALPTSKMQRLGQAAIGGAYAGLASKCLNIAQKQDILALLKSNAAATHIIDARSEAEHRGTQATAKRNGAIPGSKHLEWSDLLDKETHRFKTADELKKLLAEAGIDLTKPLIVYGRAGGDASVMAFALELMGAKNVKNYYAGWAEWGNDPNTPIEPGKIKAK